MRIRGVDIYLYAFLTLALDTVEWSVSLPAPFALKERDPGIQCKGGWVGRREGLDAVVRRKTPSP